MILDRIAVELRLPLTDELVSRQRAAWITTAPIDPRTIYRPEARPTPQPIGLDASSSASSGMFPPPTS